MKTWQLSAFGLENLNLTETEKPEAGPGQVLVQFKAASINYRDILVANGLYNPNIELPLIPVSDGAGDVVAVGEGVTSLAVGDKVVPFFFPMWDDGLGTWAKRGVSMGCEMPGVLREFGAYDAGHVIKVPDYLTYEEAACLPIAGLTAWSALTTWCGVKEGDTVLAQGTGGVSLFVVQFAKAMGATVIATSSSDEKLARVKALGADHLINYKETPEWGAKAAELSGGGVNAIVEVGGAGTLAQSIAACGVGGQISIIGNLAGVTTEFEILPVVGKNISIHGQTCGNHADQKAMQAFMDQHQIKPVVDKVFPFAEADKALGAILQGQHFGKIVVRY